MRDKLREIILMPARDWTDYRMAGEMVRDGTAETHD
jgi:hypothetical protein